MIIADAAIVMGVNDLQVTGKFMDKNVEIASEKSVTCIETRADLGGIDPVQDPQNIARISKEQMRQFVFQHANDAELFAALGHLVQ
jgi:hypothetical protein